MPGYSGLEVCQRLKEAGETSRIPVLLTVGKLEPFKPEEAKRVRADGYIVKPFEASELLSALAKLEDKVVPRGESSKPGRFARAIAAVEEGRYDKAAGADEDNGWKSRIGFPSKKKEKAEPENGDDSAIYNPVNKDLRTVVDRPAAAKETAAEERVDLGALAPEGLPKDVTPEEIAALAAAAAQMQGKIAGPKDAEPLGAPARNEAARDVEERANPTPAAAAESVVVEAKAAAQPAEQESKREEIREETKATTASPAEMEVVRQVPDLAAVTPADVMAAIDGLDTVALSTIAPTASADTCGTSDLAARTEAEPVTMAVAAGAERAFLPSRWSAVPVTLAPEEAAIILEEEMRKAYAAQSDVEVAPVQAMEPAFASQIAPAQPTAAEEVPPINAAQPASTPAEPEVARTDNLTVNPTISPEASPATEVFRAAVKNFETVTSPSVETTSHQPADLEPAPATAEQSAAKSEPESLEPAEAKTQVEERTEEIQVAPLAQTEALTAEAIAPAIAHDEPMPGQASQPGGEHRSEEQRSIEPQKSEEPEPAVPAVAVQAADEAEAISAERPADPAVDHETLAEVPASRSFGDSERPDVHTVRGSSEAAKNESDLAATTAAAWASWRRVRESSDPASATSSKDKAEHKNEDQASAPPEAAMAVAAGAERAPEEAETPEIANIVDSVLADLRPKIVEEISRKLKKRN
jgi:hypothetical protein